MSSNTTHARRDIRRDRKHIYYKYLPNRDLFVISGSVLRQMLDTVAENAREDLRRKMAVTTDKA